MRKEFLVEVIKDWSNMPLPALGHKFEKFGIFDNIEDNSGNHLYILDFIVTDITWDALDGEIFLRIKLTELP